MSPPAPAPEPADPRHAMQRVLVVPDGAAEPRSPGATSLETATTLALDRLAERGAVRRVRTTPPGLHAGSETGLPLLLGWAPSGPVSRGRIEAAARGIETAAGAAVHRVDVRRADGRPWPELAGPARDLLAAANRGHEIHRLGGHRLLAIGDGEPIPPAATALSKAAGVGCDGGDDAGPRIQIWPDGAIPPPILTADTVVVCAANSTAAGVAALMGTRTLHPAGATGRPGTNVGAKARAAITLLNQGVATVIVHVGAPDEAAHDHDPGAKVREIERIDRELLAPLAGSALDRGAIVAVCPDHATDPHTGRHGPEPVPALLFGPGIPRSGPDRMTEAATAGAAVVDGPWAAA